MTKIFALGGSVITKDTENIPKLAKAINQHSEQVGVVTGAGKLKKYIEAAETNQFGKDTVGMYATRLHAKTIQTMIQNTYSKIPRSSEELERAANSNQNFVTGGITPGYSTDAVAALAAEASDAQLFIASKIDGIYEKDPKIEDSEKIDNIKPEKIRQILKSSNKAGKHSLIDKTALRIIERSEIPTTVMEGKPENLKNPEEATGTQITH